MRCKLVGEGASVQADKLSRNEDVEAAGSPSPRAISAEEREGVIQVLDCLPDRLGSIEDSRDFRRSFFPWYNHYHRHSGVALMTPAAVLHKKVSLLHADRSRVLAAAYAERPERFVSGVPHPPELPTSVWINCPPQWRLLSNVTRGRLILLDKFRLA